MNKFAIIVAGGSGTRMGSQVPKQFMTVNGKPVLMHTLEAFHRYDKTLEITLVLPENQVDTWMELCKQHGYTITHDVVIGGDTRFASVKNGLANITREGLIAIHDGVRPLVSQDTIRRCFNTAEAFGNAVPVIKISESVRTVVDEYSRPIDRSNLRLVQTPQVFRSDLLKEAYLQNYRPEFTDDASVIEQIGHQIQVVEGNPENIKITTPYDLELAGFLLGKGI